MGWLAGWVTLIAIVFVQVINPMILSYLVIGMGGAVMLYLGFLLPSFWFSYVILLTFLGGLLVVFVYVASLCPNEPIMGVSGWIWLLVLVMMMVSWFWWSAGDSGFLFGWGEMLCLMKMYYGGVESMISLLVVYLLLVLLVVVDLSLVFEGSLSVNYGG